MQGSRRRCQPSIVGLLVFRRLALCHWRFCYSCCRGGGGCSEGPGLIILGLYRAGSSVVVWGTTGKAEAFCHGLSASGGSCHSSDCSSAICRQVHRGWAGPCWVGGSTLGDWDHWRWRQTPLGRPLGGGNGAPVSALGCPLTVLEVNLIEQVSHVL